MASGVCSLLLGDGAGGAIACSLSAKAEDVVLEQLALRAKGLASTATSTLFGTISHVLTVQNGIPSPSL